jgi:two-component system, NtrC family, sensor histidine kinase HydH
MQQERAIPSSARLGLLATTLLLAVALVGGSWMNYRGTQAAGWSLNRSQADVIAAQLREAFHPWTPLPDSAALHGVMEAHPTLAIRYIALLDQAGNVGVSAGEPALPPAPAPEEKTIGPGSPPMTAAGDRVRTYLPRPVPGPPETERGGAAAPARRQGPGPPRFAFSLVEFEPVMAAELVGRARLFMVLATVAAALLTLAALVFWRQAVRYEAERQQVEHQRRLSQLGEMSAVLAHEIRNPLASLKGNAQLLVERLAPESREHARAKRVVHEATRLQALTSDLLDFARSGSIDPHETNPAELLRVAVEEVGEDRVAVEADAAPARWMLDASRIRQALVNLLRNAVQVSPEERPPVAHVSGEGGRLVFIVRDFGPGLPDGAHERIFDPFFTTRTYGTGLGFAVARRAIELHGGSLSADNHPEGGAVFRITLPGAGAKGSNGSHPDR